MLCIEAFGSHQSAWSTEVLIVVLESRQDSRFLKEVSKKITVPICKFPYPLPTFELN